MFLSLIGTVHMAAAMAAIGLGSLVLIDVKATPTHRLLGMGFALAMIIVNVTALAMYRMTGFFGPFHALALLSLLALARGLWPLVARKADWLRLHYRYMSISYGGLLAAAITESLVRIPATRVYVNTAERIFVLGIGIAVAMFIFVRVVLPRLERRTLRLAVIHMQTPPLNA